MNDIVLMTLRRPYTFVILSILVLLFNAISVLQRAARHRFADQTTSHRFRLDL
jgi:hypothetical protein